MTKSWCYSFDNSEFVSGSFDSVGEALKAAKLDSVALNEDAGYERVTAVYVAEHRLATNKGMYPDAAIILEHMACQAYDISGQYAEEYPDVPKEQEDDLTEQLHILLDAWCDKIGLSPSFYSVLESKKYNLTTFEEIVSE